MRENEEFGPADRPDLYMHRKVCGVHRDSIVLYTDFLLYIVTS